MRGLARVPLVLLRPMSTEAAAPGQRRFMSMTLDDLSGIGIVLTIIGSTLAVGAMLANYERRSDVAIATITSKLEERMAGTTAALKSDMAGVMKEVDAKISGAKETITKEVDAKISGAKDEFKATVAGSEKLIDAKITGFKEAADLKVRTQPARVPYNSSCSPLFLITRLPPSPSTVQEVIDLVSAALAILFALQQHNRCFYHYTL